MFNVIRPVEAPAALARGEYNTHEVVRVLNKMFFGKCYLCERGSIEDVEVEHFEPHMGDEALKFDWHNLFYSCSRCNGIKSSKHKNLLDCTDENIDVFRAIKLRMPSLPDDNIIVEAADASPSIQVKNTVKLLERCYNETNTALRGVSREALVEQIYEYLLAFMQARQLLKHPSTPNSRKQEAIEIIEAMMGVKHPFSAFWRWQYLEDSFLTEEYPELKNNL